MNHVNGLQTSVSAAQTLPEGENQPDKVESVAKEFFNSSLFKSLEGLFKHVAFTLGSFFFKDLAAEILKDSKVEGMPIDNKTIANVIIDIAASKIKPSEIELIPIPDELFSAAIDYQAAAKANKLKRDLKM